ncbi:MAG: hypothetical protein MPEBLZ_01937 [Candidatus Methanoperedens nitroreducens]|uniref:Uncharacterized protein n=1 Tax=Candidatus Methanoperedens nitratireducens TaxID=1392998 RepID=A0A0N8KR00_9EURY|nr:hypothetical protein [Candidatus Methanoperedens sp. BLZ2]KAB2946797.1 MAG: hypothetical protein F9K14_06490 [Candidatus Methanoperedens sp.]KPQ43554.1 MAG: hypothetical protein MPEBLZ_01937 [Candidatus Methanoperedens sp. BLZ1]MBZ0175781.1 hypothetical protein [Candidatus Methanoperedens nitroreducens]MCX9079238.1 hypothetical protein [Candidatus Methanoperedens sp.]
MDNGTISMDMAATAVILVAGNQVTIYEGGKVIQNFTLPEGEEYTWNTSNGGVYISGGIGRGVGDGKLNGRSQAERETELNKSINIARNDSRVQDLLESKGLVERRRRGMGNIVLLK